MRRLSLNARMAQDNEGSDEIEVVLFYIDHPLLDQPIRLSSDNTERLSDDPLLYGTRSTWMGSNPIDDPFYFVVASALVPSDLEDAPSAGSFVIENVDNEIAKILRSFSGLATIHIAVVLASSPNLVEAEFQDMRIMTADIDAGEVTIEFSREDIEDEKYPGGRMTKTNFPGMFR